ncbi:MAG: glutathione S-transferase, partial [Leptospira sp.]|nr:glutathione S-transferase [Leptospira sp.]
MKPKLYIFAISHFSEKARFLLDKSGIEYEPVYLTPGEHIAVVKEFAPESYVPVLRGENFLVQGSSEIVEYAKNHGQIPSVDWDQEFSLMQKIDNEIGYPIQPIVYSYLLEREDVVARMFASAPNQPVTFPNYKLIVLGLKRRYKITDANIQERKETLKKGVEFLNSEYSQKPFLVGNKLTIADITAASLISPLIFPKEHPNASWFTGVDFPPSMKEWIAELSGGA